MPLPLLTKPALIAGAVCTVAVGLMYVRMEFAINREERATILMEQAKESLAFSEQQNAALAARFVEEVQAHHAAQLREQQLAEERRSIAAQARREHERISNEIMASLGTEACTAASVPAGAVDGLREYAAFANGLRGDPGQPVRPGPLRVD